MFAANLGTYGERYRQLIATEAGRARPVLCYGASMSLDWFPTMLSGDQQAFADSNWRLSKTILDMCDANSEVYDLSTEEEKAKAR